VTAVGMGGGIELHVAGVEVGGEGWGCGGRTGLKVRGLWGGPVNWREGIIEVGLL
jgi:hypothetical protein